MGFSILKLKFPEVLSRAEQKLSDSIYESLDAIPWMTLHRKSGWWCNDFTIYGSTRFYWPNSAIPVDILADFNTIINIYQSDRDQLQIIFFSLPLYIVSMLQQRRQSRYFISFSEEVFYPRVSMTHSLLGWPLQVRLKIFMRLLWLQFAH